jgi:G3E family GTPase
MKISLNTAAQCVLCICGLLVFWISKMNVSHDQLENRLAIGFWGIQPKSVKLSITKSNVWSWRKLVVAGCMFCCVLILMISKKFGNKNALLLATGLFTCWVIFLLFFWYFVVAKKEPEINNNKKQDELSTNTGWLSKTRVEPKNDVRLPVTVITGYLGSGKTTLIKHLLSNTIGMKILVVENEIGEEGIDHELLMKQTGKEDIILMNNGCICCTVRKDLVLLFHQLFKLEKLSQLDWVVIETTGLADPAPVIQSLYMDIECKRYLRLDGVLTVADAYHLPLHMKHIHNNNNNNNKEDIKQSNLSNFSVHGTIPEAIQQLMYADRIILNKMDLLSSKDDINNIINDIQMINPNAKIIQSTHSKVNIDDIIDINAFNPLKCNEILSTITTTNNNITPSNIFQIQLDKDGKIITNKKKGQQGIIFQNPNSHVSTISLVSDVALDFNRFNKWLAMLLRENGKDIYRCKGQYLYIYIYILYIT